MDNSPALSDNSNIRRQLGLFLEVEMTPVLDMKFPPRPKHKSAEVVGVEMAKPLSRVAAMKAQHFANVLNGLSIIECPATRNLRAKLEVA